MHGEAVTHGAHGPAFPPGPPAPKRGILGRIVNGVSLVLDPVGFVGGRFIQYGDIYYVPAGDQPGLYVLKHPDHIRDVLITNAASFDKTHSGLRALGGVLGEGLLTTDGDVWRRQRRMVQPAFTRQRLADYSVVMSDEAAADAASYRDGEVVDMSTRMMEVTLRVVSRTLLGYSAASSEAEDVRRAMKDLQDSLISVGQLGPRWLSPAHRKSRRSAALLDGIIFGMIEKRRRDGAPSGPVDLLSMLLSVRDDEGDGGGLIDREIRDQLLTLYIAGHETTANALTWSLYLLSQNPEAEAKLHAELERVLGGRTPTFDDIGALVYTDRVIAEAMRLYPPVPAIARKAHEDTRIGEWRVPAGSEVVIWIYHTHHDPTYYPEPWKFRPERWEEAEASALPKQAYLPFGAGARTCIGKVFAQIEAVLVLATLAQNARFTLEPGHPVELRSRLTLNPKHGMRMIAKRRSQ